MAPCSDVVPSQGGGALAVALPGPCVCQEPPGTPSRAPRHRIVRLRGADDHACWVAVPPNIEPSAVDLAILENGTVSLECLASGLPAPSESVRSLGSCSHTPGAFPGSPR